MKTLEKTIQEKLARQLGGAIEVKTPYGRIDILTPTSIIEIKKVSLFKSALGQLNFYSTYYPKHKKKLYLFGHAPKLQRYTIQLACKPFDVEVYFEDDIILN